MRRTTKIKILVATILAIIAGMGIFVIFFIVDSELSKKDNGSFACTAEAKICPDGTAVGRVGAKCEFAECPEAPNNENAGKATLDLKIGQSGEANDVTISPLRVVEDSRCPIDVTCIQAGRIRVEVKLLSGLGASKSIFEVGGSITTEAEVVTLMQVTPSANSQRQIKSDDYQFTFEVRRRAN